MDGYRAIAFKTAGKLHLRSRNNNDFAKRYPGVLKGLAKLPNETVIDGEVVAFDPDRRPRSIALQNFASAETAIVSYVFDLLVLAGRDVRGETLEPRRELLERRVVHRRRLHVHETTRRCAVSGSTASGAGPSSIHQRFGTWPLGGREHS